MSPSKRSPERVNTGSQNWVGKASQLLVLWGPQGGLTLGIYSSPAWSPQDTGIPKMRWRRIVQLKQREVKLWSSMSCPHFETLVGCLTLQLANLCHLVCVRHVEVHLQMCLWWENINIRKRGWEGEKKKGCPDEFFSPFLSLSLYLPE